MLKVVVNGAAGKMGRISVATLEAHTDFKVVSECGRHDDLGQVLSQQQPDIALDFTLPDCVYQNAQIMIEAGVRPLIGTSGLTLEQIESLSTLSQARGLGGMIVPNFSIAAVLMMQFAKQAANYLPDLEIVELHHENKIDAPSGTARKTAELIAGVTACDRAEKSLAEHCYQGVPIHSVRMPGLFAHQAVIFRGEGETLTIKHDAHSRESMMAGLVLACQHVMTLSSLCYGLDSAIGLHNL